MAPETLRVAGPWDIALLLLMGPAWVLWALGTGYLLVLAAAAAVWRPSTGRGAPRSSHICVLIPAHNEELLLGTVLDRLMEARTADGSPHVVVIADNCEDRTAEVARAHGAEALERRAPDQRGKGWALAWALERLLADPRAFQAFVVVDADSVLSEGFFGIMSGALAAGCHVIQGRYEVLNTLDSWRTRLMACALALAHHVKPLGRRRLGLSDGLKGNGMCFSRDVLCRIPWSGESITEDIDYTLRLVEAGERIVYEPSAIVRAQMPTTGRQAATQRERWEGGRYALVPRAARLLLGGLAGRRWLLADRAAELIIPPLSEMLALPTALAAGSLLWSALCPGSLAARIALIGWLSVLAGAVLYLSAGLVIARVPWSVASALALAPVYVIWKLCLYGGMLVRRGPGGWHRTERRAL